MFMHISLPFQLTVYIIDFFLVMAWRRNSEGNFMRTSNSWHWTSIKRGTFMAWRSTGNYIICYCNPYIQELCAPQNRAKAALFCDARMPLILIIPQVSASEPSCFRSNKLGT